MVALKLLSFPFTTSFKTSKFFTNSSSPCMRSFASSSSILRHICMIVTSMLSTMRMISDCPRPASSSPSVRTFPICSSPSTRNFASCSSCCCKAIAASLIDFSTRRALSAIFAFMLFTMPRMSNRSLPAFSSPSAMRFFVCSSPAMRTFISCSSCACKLVVTSFSCVCKVIVTSLSPSLRTAASRFRSAAMRSSSDCTLPLSSTSPAALAFDSSSSRLRVRASV
mmetsp:Transcript_37963/g.66943  ORF Transcript_37963/g.66943 Transcript_37963/m.66943 type:complete len:224 (-) Transcript_37963:17-688(-)